MSYRLFAVDMDGTSLNSRHELSEENISTFRRLTENGVRVIILTGRMYSSALRFYERIGLDTLLVSYNGARIHDNKGNLVYRKELSADIVGKLSSLPDMRENKVLPLFFIDERLVVPWRDDNTLEYETRTGIKAEIDKDILKRSFYSTKFLLSSTNYEYLSFLKNKIYGMFGDSLYVTNSMPRYVEVLDSEVSKGNALRFCAEYYNISLKDCVVVGDNNNDAAMFLPECLKVAVGNAERNLKEKADIITLTNDENGVSCAAGKIFFGE